MSESEGYDVLRLIEHSRSCYVSSEYVKGMPLIKWLKYYPNLSKGQLFLWIHEMAKQLECIHRCRGKPCYRYVNPYCIIITGKKELYFLDMNAKSNERTIAVIQRRSVREHFLPPEESYYQTESIFLDIYGLGKTIQYLLSASEPEPGLTKGEEVRFQKIISRSLDRHSKRAYTQVSQLRKHIPVIYIRSEEKHILKRRTFLMITAMLILASGLVLYPYFVKRTGYRREADPSETGGKSMKDTPEEREISALKRELGLLYFLDKKDYEKSREYFAEDKEDRLSGKLMELSEYMIVKDASGQEAELKTLLEEMETAFPEEEKEKYYRCLIEGYRLLEDEEAAKEIILLGRQCRKNAEESVRRELTGYMAFAYEKAGEIGNAIEEYQDMLKWESGDGFKEEVYKKLIFLYQEREEPDQAGRICRRGIEELGASAELRLIHIRMLCADTEVEREICAQTVKKYIEEMPEIVEKEEFGKLKQEYGIIMEGEDLWVGR